MGVQVSKASSVTKSTSEVVNDIIKETSQSCSGSTTASQILDISGIRTKGCKVNISNVSQSGKVESKFECFQSQQSSTDMENKFKKHIDDKVEAANSGVGLGWSQADSQSLTETKNKLVNSFKMSNVATCLASTSVDQMLRMGDYVFDCTYGDELKVVDEKITRLETKGSEVELNAFELSLLNTYRQEKQRIQSRPPIEVSIGNISQDLFLKAATNCVQKQTDAQKLMNDFDEKILKSTAAKVEGFNLELVLVIIFVCLVFGAIIYLFMTGRI